MASIQKRGKRWVVEVRSKGKYTSKSFDSRSEAKEWADTEERKLGKLKGIVLGKTLGQAFEKYKTEVSEGKKGQRWEVIRLNKLQRDSIADLPIASLSTEDLQDWIKRQKLAPSSINRELNLISGVLTVARKRWKWLESNPMTDVERPINPAARDKTYSDEQILAICDALGYKGEIRNQRHLIAVAVLLSVETGMRQGELFGLTWERVNIEKRYASLPETKNGSKRDVPLSAKAIKLINSIPKVADKLFPFSQASCAKIFKGACTIAGIEGLTWHDLRHTAVTRLASKLEMLDLARMVGHRDPRSLLGYYNPKPQDIARKLD